MPVVNFNCKNNMAKNFCARTDFVLELLQTSLDGMQSQISFWNIAYDTSYVYMIKRSARYKDWKYIFRGHSRVYQELIFCQDQNLILRFLMAMYWFCDQIIKQITIFLQFIPTLDSLWFGTKFKTEIYNFTYILYKL